MSSVAYGLNTIDVLWRRDLKRFFRQPSRIIGALGQPVIFWLVLGSGLSATFTMAGQSLDYMEFFFPGVVAMVLLFASIFASLSIIEDRHQGFLQSVLAGPGSRAALVVGKCLGSASVALIQACVFLLLAPVAGFSFAVINWPLLASAMLLAALGLTALGFAVAWLVDNVQAYHALQLTLLVPLWMVSGAMFPPERAHGIFTVVMTLNPVAYAVAAMRQALYGGSAPDGTLVVSAASVNFGVLALFAAVSLLLAIQICERVRR